MGQLAAEYATGTIAASPCTTCYVAADHLGSTRALWDSSGLKARYDYHPFGEAIAADRNGRTGMQCSAGVATCYNGPSSVAQRFTGQLRDEETGLDYFNARYLASAMGRFMSADVPFADQHSIDPQTWNLFSYTANNPMSRIDPNGYNWFNVNGGWEWHEGDTYDPDGPKGKQKPIKSNYTHLLVFQQTGYNRQGSAVGTLTLYNQDKRVFDGTAFTGGADGFSPVDDGTYSMDLRIRDEKGPTQIDPNSIENNPPPFYGIQNISRSPLPKPGESGLFDVYSAYGPTRVRLNPSPGNRDRGAYLHGQTNGVGMTHGCLCYGSDTRFVNYLWKLSPQRVPLIVNQKFRPPTR